MTARRSTRITDAVVLALALASSVAAAQDDWQGAYRVGDAVELKVTDLIWQRCEVSENPPGGLMRVDCAEYVEPSPGTDTHAGGVLNDRQAACEPC